jgi:hypothetical protein
MLLRLSACAGANAKMNKAILLLIGITSDAVVPTFAQGYIDFTWIASSVGVQIAVPSNPSSQLPGWFVQGDYSVEAWMAVGSEQSEALLNPIASTRTVFLGGETTTAIGNPQFDGSGLFESFSFSATGLSLGPATIEVRAWYDPNHNTTYYQALAAHLNTGKSGLYNISLTGPTDPTIQNLDLVGMQPFTVSSVPEPSTFALFALGLVLFFLRGQSERGQLVPQFLH